MVEIECVLFNEIDIWKKAFFFPKFLQFFNFVGINEPGKFITMYGGTPLCWKSASFRGGWGGGVNQYQAVLRFLMVGLAFQYQN